MPPLSLAPTRYFLLSLLLLGAHPTHAQVIITVAGTDKAGFSGDGGPATSATLTIPLLVGMECMTVLPLLRVPMFIR